MLSGGQKKGTKAKNRSFRSLNFEVQDTGKYISKDTGYRSGNGDGR